MVDLTRETPADGHVFEDIADAMPHMVWLAGLDGGTTYYNRRILEYTGLPASVTLGTEWERLVHPDDVLASRAAWLHSVETGEPFETEYRLRRHDGAYRWFLGRAHTQLDGRGQVVRWAGTCTDIQKLRRTAELLKAVADGTTDAVFVKDRDGKYLLANSATARFVGRADGDLLGRTDAELFDPDSARLVAERDRQVMTAGVAETKMEELTAAGVTRTYLATKAPYRDEDGAVIGLIGITRDVTELKRAEEALARDAMLLANVRDSIIVTDPDGVITYWNEGATRLYGWTAQEMLGKTVTERVPEGEARRAVLDRLRAVQRCGEFQGEWEDSRQDGSRFWVEGRIGRLEGQAGFLGLAHDVSDRKRAEEALRQSEERTRLLLDSTAEAIYGIDPDGRCTFANLACARLLGYAETRHLLGQNMHEFIHHSREDGTPYPEEECHIYRAFRQGEGSHVEGEVYWRADGSCFPAEYWSYPIRRGAETLGAVVTFWDISERRLAEQTRRKLAAERDELLARLRMQIDRMPLAYLLFDADLRVIDWNESAARIFGYGKDEVLGMGPPFEKIVPASAGPHAQEILRRLRSGDMAAHGINENRTKDGRTIICQWYNTPLLDGDGTFAGLISLAQDVTASRQAEEALRLRDRAVQAVTQGILITDPSQPDNPIIYSSPSFEQMTGYAAAEVVGRNCRFLQGKETDPDAIAQLRRAIRDGQPYTTELLNYRKDGEPFWNELSVSPVRDEEGRLTHFVGVQTDVTERRRLEEQYRQAQKMEAFGQLAGGVAHDFNNLLTIINGYSNLLLGTLPPDDPNRTLVSEIHKAGERSAGLTRQLLAFSRQQVLALRVLDLNAVVGDTASMLRRVIGEDVKLTTTTASGLWPVKADLGQVEQILLNLAVNARDAMPTGGKLTIETGNVVLDEAYAASHPDARAGSHVLLAVSDTGCGMSAAVRAKIFEPFFTTKGPGKGTGLGLATVYGIVKQSGGHVGVYSEVGIGTTFKVYLPRTEQAGEEEKSHSAPRTLPRGTETVLVVEDESVVRALSRHILQLAGYAVLEAAGGDEALRVANGHAGRIHLLVTDVVMPGLGGREVAERMAERHPGLRVLFVSGYTDDAVVRHGVLHDNVNFLQKPFTPASLAWKVREVLDQPSS